VCIDRGSEFYLRKIRRDTIVLIPAEVQEKQEAVQGVHRLVKSLRTYQLRLRIEGLLLQGVHRVEISNTQKYLIDCRKECMQEFFRGLKLPEKAQEG
jgi:hypothetical protein